MNPANMKDYRSLMDDVDLPDRVRGAVAEESTRLRTDALEPDRCGPARRSRVAGRPLSRRVALGACAAALTAVFASALALDAPARLSGLLEQPKEPESGPVSQKPASTGNFFALAAYAAENPSDETGKPVAVSLRDFQPGSPWGRTTLSTGEEDPNGAWLYAFLFDVTCTGENIASITYEIVGDGAYFESYDEEEFLRAHGVYGDDDPAVENGYDIDDSSTFTVDYEKQDLRENRISCHLIAPYVPRDETIALDGRLLEADEEEFGRIANEYSAAVAADASEGLREMQLKLTATFEDGSTQTKRYVIAPVDGFEDAYRAYLDAWDAAYRETGSTEGVEQPKLYTIEEIVES